MNLILPQAPADADQKLKDYAQEVKKALQGLADQLGSSTATASPAAFAGNVSTLANNSADANNSVDVTYQVLAGETILTRASVLTKKLNSSWAYGTGQGGLDTGVKAVSTGYYVWAIGKTTGEVDALFSTSGTAPTMPNGWTLKKVVGWVRTDGSGNILGFTQFGRYFEWKVIQADKAFAGSASTSRQTQAVTAPFGADARVVFVWSSGTGNSTGWAQSTSFTDVAPSAAACNMSNPTGGGIASYTFDIPVDSSRLIAWRQAHAWSLGINTLGFTLNI